MRVVLAVILSVLFVWACGLHAGSEMDTRHDARQAVTIAPSVVTIVADVSQILHRPAMNDQQEAAPRPNGLMLDQTYRGFIPIPTTELARTLRPQHHPKGFRRGGSIRDHRLSGAKIPPTHRN
jgi:hypothetical protein